jgi:hypothetical protein
MTTTIQSALENIKDIYMSDSSLSTLLDFERVIDELDVYVFENWKQGELVAGPEYEKYFVTCTFMWPYKKMPDPRGGEQLLNYNCEVLYKKDELEFPVKPKNESDFRPGTKMPKTKSVPVWLVTITMPKSLMTDIQRGSVEVENEKLDMEEIESAYEQGDDDAQTETQDQGMGDQGMDQMGGDPNMPQPGAAPAGM